MKFSRRMVLKGAGGIAVALPVLEGLAPRRVRAAGEMLEPYAIFFRQANGVAAEQSSDLGAEPEKFWPTQTGPLTAATVQDRALDELTEHLDKILVVGNVNMNYFDYADGHANGAMQGLTARGPVVANQGGDSEADGESLDHRIGAELNPDSRDSLFLYGGPNGGWLGGACISYRGSNNRRAPLHNPVNAYQTMMGIDSDLFDELIARQSSINDVVRGQMNSLLARPELSSDDKRRLELHMQSIRDLEESLSCNLTDDEAMMLEGMGAAYESNDGDLLWPAIRAHMDVAALAVTCGYTRSVAIQVGEGNDTTRYRDPDSGDLMENYHYVSHRQLAHDGNGSVYPNSDILHHKVDRQFAQAFKYLIDKLLTYPSPSGGTLLDDGVAVWYNDNGNGPGHSANNVPYILAGNACGYFRQGEYLELSGGGGENHARMLNTIGAAVGVTNAGGNPLDDFGDPGLARGQLDELKA